MSENENTAKKEWQTGGWHKEKVTGGRKKSEKLTEDQQRNELSECLISLLRH